MTLVNQIKSDTTQAMKDGNKAKLSTLRLLVSELEKEKVSMKLADVNGLKDEQVQTVISRQIKKLDKEIEAYQNVNRSTESQEAEKELLISYLPKQATAKEIRELTYRAVNLARRREINNPMQYLSQRLKGKADMKLVSKVVKEVQRELDDDNA